MTPQELHEFAYEYEDRRHRTAMEIVNKLRRNHTGLGTRIELDQDEYDLVLAAVDDVRIATLDALNEIAERVTERPAE